MDKHRQNDIETLATKLFVKAGPGAIAPQGPSAAPIAARCFEAACSFYEVAGEPTEEHTRLEAIASRIFVEDAPRILTPGGVSPSTVAVKCFEAAQAFEDRRGAKAA